jgi:vacuolar protein sorting-associated protein 35
LEKVLEIFVTVFDVVLIQVDVVLTMLSPLIQDQSDQPPGEEDPEDFAEEQGLLGRSVKSTNSWKQFSVLYLRRGCMHLAFNL